MADEQLTLVSFLVALENDVFAPLLQRSPQLIREDLRPLAEEAWPQVQAAIVAVRQVLSESPPEVQESIERALGSAGLQGVQLQLKLRGFFGALRRRVGRWRGSLVRWFREVLAWANVILGSLATVLPVVEIIKEYKETLEIGIRYPSNA